MSSVVGKVWRKARFDWKMMDTQGSAVNLFSLVVCKQEYRSLVGLQSGRAAQIIKAKLTTQIHHNHKLRHPNLL
jgi:hypothetical protein